MNKKVIIFSAPSGSGKSTIVNHLLEKYPSLEFSVSATSRAPRGDEKEGKDYYFFTNEQFKELISKNAFVEYEEVYSGSFYGTLKSEVERIWNKGNVIIFDIDVKGGMNLKKLFGDEALSIFIKTSSVGELRDRLVKRGTETPESIAKRIDKAKEELSYEKYFDRSVVNDSLERALAEVEAIVEQFLNE